MQLTPVDQTPEVLAELDPLSPAVLPETDDVALESAEVSAPTTEQFDRLYRPEALDVPVLIARDGPISAIDPNTIGALAPERSREEGQIASRLAVRPDTAPFAVPGEALVAPIDEVAGLDTPPEDVVPPVQVVEAASPSVSLLAVRPSWVRVQSVDGTIVFEKILDAGETFEVPLTEEPAQLRAGNAGSLYFAVNGQTYGPAGDGPSVVKGIVLAPEALQESYAVADIDSDTDLARFVAVAEAQAAQTDE